MILHIAPDEKFIKMAVHSFEEVNPNNNKFIITKLSRNPLYLDEKEFTFLTEEEITSNTFISELALYEFVVIHYLDKIKQSIISKAPKGIKFVWLGWGADYIDLMSLPDSFILQKTFSKISSRNNLIYKIIKTVRLKFKNFKTKKILSKIDYFIPVLESEFNLIVNKHKINFKYLPWNYGSIEGYYKLNANSPIIKNDNFILLGNSANFSNNHFEIFDLLNNIDLGKRKIYCPVCYGNQNYKEKIITYGVELFGDKIFFQENFIDKDLYLETLYSCSTVIMNHLRQQAYANIVVTLYMGSTVFLQSTNPIFIFLKGKGLKLFSVEELEQKKSLINIRLKKSEIMQNRLLLGNILGQDSIKQKTKDLIEKVKAY